MKSNRNVSSGLTLDGGYEPLLKVARGRTFTGSPVPLGGGVLLHMMWCIIFVDVARERRRTHRAWRVDGDWHYNMCEIYQRPAQ